jgi:hypothetical protein
LQTQQVLQHPCCRKIGCGPHNSKRKACCADSQVGGLAASGFSASSSSTQAPSISLSPSHWHPAPRCHQPSLHRQGRAAQWLKSEWHNVDQRCP